MNKTKLSVILPVCNEEHNLAPLVEKLSSTLDKLQERYEMNPIPVFAFKTFFDYN